MVVDLLLIYPVTSGWDMASTKRIRETSRVATIKDGYDALTTLISPYGDVHGEFTELRLLTCRTALFVGCISLVGRNDHMPIRPLELAY